MKLTHNRLQFTLFFLLCCIFLAAWSHATGAVFKVGTARRDITPKEPMPLWGYGSRHDALSTGVLDPLYATALVMQCETDKLALVTLDLGRTPTEATLQSIRRQIAEQKGIGYSFIAASHTHNGPVMELTEKSSGGKFEAALRYYKKLELEIVSAIGEANDNLADARVGVTSIQLRGLHRNRQLTAQPEVGDHALTLARFDTTSGKVSAILVNFTAHPTLVEPSVLKFSADFVGSLRTTVESTMPGHLIFIQGAAADQSADPSAGNDPNSFGAQLGREVINAAGKIVTKMPLRARLQITEDRFKFASRVDLTNPAVRSRLDHFFFPELVASYADEYAGGIQPRLTVAALDNDLVFVGVSGEFFSKHSLQLKERFQSQALFFFGYCNGYHQYFPTIEAVAQGGYGTEPSQAPVSLGAGEIMMDTALIRLFQMFGRIPSGEKVFISSQTPSSTETSKPAPRSATSGGPTQAPH